MRWRCSAHGQAFAAARGDERLGDVLGFTDIEKIGLAYFKDRVEICKKVNAGE